MIQMESPKRKMQKKNWDVNAIPVDKQKLDEIKKQKPEETKKVQDRNKERARKLGR